MLQKPKRWAALVNIEITADDPELQEKKTSDADLLAHTNDFHRIDLYGFRLPKCFRLNIIYRLWVEIDWMCGVDVELCFQSPGVDASGLQLLFVEWCIHWLCSPFWPCRHRKKWRLGKEGRFKKGKWREFSGKGANIKSQAKMNWLRKETTIDANETQINVPDALRR